MKILIVIPARGGSKRIPRKNVRIMCGRPLIQYSLDNALSLSQKYETDVVVSTDDEEVENIAGKRQGIRVLKRPEELARDSITLDPVIYDALCRMEEEKGIKYDLVLTMQATSPTLKKETLLAAVEEFIAGDLDTMISVVNRTHLSWKEENGKIVKNYEKRLNSQELPKNFQETGGFLLSRRTVVNRDSRIGEKVGVYEIDSFEAVDIDTEEDWIVAEAILRRKRILFRTVGQQKLGMGHIYRCLTLAYKLIGHELLFVTDEESTLGIQKLKESFFPMKVIKDEAQFEQILCDYRPDIVVNDILDTEAS
ncbi:MAG: UDP-2,4-diacetamido-2,4,6-trideoxy-beta-L-altropyranose hydrolase, partial [Lachnospiraceae bacterium]|nr:UDP-2,4-diacetamido-2,4,6-trideoxy-beta-L-altropyranose hydrolase [Lachnospiraceae bacterium]